MGITRAIALTVAAVATVLTVTPGAHASAPEGTITSPAAGASATVGTPVTATAETNGVCEPRLEVRAPAGELVKVAVGNAGPMCGPTTFSGTYTPVTPGKHQVKLVKATGDTLAEAPFTADTPPTTASPSPTATVTITTEATPTVSPSATPSPTVTVTRTVTPKPTATPIRKATPTARPTVTRTLHVRSTPDRQPAPQVVIQQGPTSDLSQVPQDTPQDQGTVEHPAAAAPAPQPTQPDEMPAWLAYQLARQEAGESAPGFGTVVGAVAVVLAPIAGLVGLAWWLTRRRSQRHNHL